MFIFACEFKCVFVLSILTFKFACIYCILYIYIHVCMLLWFIFSTHICVQHEKTFNLESYCGSFKIWSTYSYFQCKYFLEVCNKSMKGFSFAKMFGMEQTVPLSVFCEAHGVSLSTSELLKMLRKKYTVLVQWANTYIVIHYMNVWLQYICMFAVTLP